MADSTTPSPEFDLRAFVRTLWARRLVVLVCVLVTTGTALGLALRSDDLYAASADVLVQPPVSGALADDNGQSVDRVQTELRILQSNSILEEVTAELGFEPDVSFTLAGESEIVEVRATAPTAEQAVEVADTYARVYVETRRARVLDELNRTTTAVQERYEATQAELATLVQPITDIDNRILGETDDELRADLLAQRAALDEAVDSSRQSLQSQLGAYSQQLGDLSLARTLVQTSGAEVTSSAKLPESPISPKPVRDAVLAMFVGLILGVALAALVDRLDDTVSTPDDVTAATGLPVLGSVPKNPSLAMRRPLGGLADRQALEAFRVLRTSLGFVRIRNGAMVRCVLVTSAEAQEGKSTTAANLALSSALAGKRTVLISADLRRPSVHEIFGLENEHGLTSALAGQRSVREVSIPVADNLTVIPSGPSSPNAAELFGTPHAKRLISAIVKVSDLVVIDCPPVLPVADTLVLAKLADAVLLVVNAERTSGRSVRRAMDLLRQVDAPMVGVVLNESRDAASGAYYDPIVTSAAAATTYDDTDDADDLDVDAALDGGTGATRAEPEREVHQD